MSGSDISYSLCIILPLLTLFGLFLSYYLIHFAQRRMFEPIKSRRPWMVILGFSLLYISMVADTVVRDILEDITPYNYLSQQYIVGNDSLTSSSDMSASIFLLDLILVAIAMCTFLGGSIVFALRGVLLWIDAKIALMTVMLSRKRNSTLKRRSKSSDPSRVCRANAKASEREREEDDETLFQTAGTGGQQTIEDSTFNITTGEETPERNDMERNSKYIVEHLQKLEHGTGSLFEELDEMKDTKEPYVVSDEEKLNQNQRILERLQKDQPSGNTRSLSVSEAILSKMSRMSRATQKELDVELSRRRTVDFSGPSLYNLIQSNASQSPLEYNSSTDQKTTLLSESKSNPTVNTFQCRTSPTLRSQVTFRTSEAPEELSISKEPSKAYNDQEISKPSNSRKLSHDSPETQYTISPLQSNRGSRSSVFSHDSTHMGIFKQSWLLRHRSWFNGGNAWLLLAIVFLIEILVLMTFFVLEFTIFRNVNAITISIVFATFLGSHLGIDLIILWQLRSIQENFGMKKELIKVNFVISIISIIKICNTAYLYPLDQWFVNIFGFRGFHCFHNAIFLGFAVYEAIIKIYKKSFPIKHLPQESATSIERDFEFLLRSREGCSLFEDFLRKEFSVENLLFYKDVLAYRKGIVSLTDMIELYIQHSAPLSINISSDARRKILSTVQSKKTDFENGKTMGKTVLYRFSSSEMHLGEGNRRNLSLFDEAFQEIRSLMFRDSFSRFRMTEECILFLKRRRSAPMARLSKLLRTTAYAIKEKVTDVLKQ